MTVTNRHRRGFTLIEMLIVGSLIVVFAGLAMLGAQELFDQSKKKAIQDEVKSIATTLSAARQDVGFYPRIYLLGYPTNLICRSGMPSGQTIATFYTVPAMDTYGYYASGIFGAKGGMSAAFTVSKNWRAPYMQLIEARKSNYRGRNSGLVKMRLSDAEFRQWQFPWGKNEDPSLVDWPTDCWGNPYVVYHVSSETTGSPARFVTANNPRGLRLILGPTEEGNFFNAVVSYGPNGVPGGGPQPGVNNDYGGFPADRLYVVGDLYGTGADYTLKSVTATGPARLDAAVMTRICGDLWAKTIDPTKVGVFDDGSDDIFCKF